MMNLTASLEHRLAPSIRAALESHGLEALERSEDVVYAVDPDLRIAYFNPAWLRFAAENGGEPAISRGWGIGAPLLGPIADPLRPFLERTYTLCTRTQRPGGFEFECSSPDVFRRVRQFVYPLASAGLLLVNALVEARPIEARERPRRAPNLGRYLDEQGFVLQCCHCRRVKQPSVETWDWIPAWVERGPMETSHGLCPLCLAYFYPTPLA